MRKRISIQIGDKTFTAIMLEDKAPATCKAIWNELPIKTLAHHAKMAGSELMCQLRKIYTDVAENSLKVYETKAGDVCWFPSRQLLLIYYAQCSPEPVDVNVFAEITENLEELRVVGREIWRNPGVPIELKKMER